MNKNINNNKDTNRKTKIIRIILIVLIAINCLTIFDFSSQNGKVSGGISKKVTITLLKAIGKESEDNAFIVEKVIRKIAHFSIYTLLGILLMCFAKTYEIPDKKRMLFCTLYVIIYASLDEFHQSFTPGRNPSVVDVFIDTLGALTGMTLILLINKVKEKNTNIKTLSKK